MNNPNGGTTNMNIGHVIDRTKIMLAMVKAVDVRAFIGAGYTQDEVDEIIVAVEKAIDGGSVPVATASAAGRRSETNETPDGADGVGGIQGRLATGRPTPDAVTLAAGVLAAAGADRRRIVRLARSIGVRNMDGFADVSGETRPEDVAAFVEDLGDELGAKIRGGRVTASINLDRPPVPKVAPNWPWVIHEKGKTLTVTIVVTDADDTENQERTQ